jgi:protein-disulfide isomerase
MNSSRRIHALARILVAAAATALLSAGAHAQRAGAGGQQGHAQADPFTVRVDQARYKGSETAPVTIVEVADFECPYCHQWFQDTYRKLDSAYVRTGKVRILFINNPLPRHLEAFAASKAALCAAAQDRFWPMHDRLFSTQQEWSGKRDVAQRFAQMAGELHLDVAAYRDCYENDRTAPLILNDVSEATVAGIDGTPTFILNGRQSLHGAVSFEEMRRAIDALLAQSPAATPGHPGR